jgi:DNA-binding FadR family transcriptional regulator
MASRLETVQLPKAAAIVADTLRRKILTHELAADEPLPPEFQLMTEMGVARTTVREALRILESENLVTVRRGAGGGARVRAPAVAPVARYIGLLLQYEGATIEDMYRARVMLETPAAGRLAENVTPAMVDGLQAALDHEARADGDLISQARAHAHFHQTVVELTGCQSYGVLAAVANRIIQVHADQYFAGNAADRRPSERIEEAHRAHVKLRDLISAGAARDAEEHWRRHLEAGDAYFKSAPGAKSVLDLLE